MGLLFTFCLTCKDISPDVYRTGCHVGQHMSANTMYPSFTAQQLPRSSPAALRGLCQQRQAPSACIVQVSAQRQPHQAAVIEWVVDNAPHQPPQSIGSIAEYGGEDINLTPRTILTPTREVDKVGQPAVKIPLRADSVRRKRKHKMNKHKHKKRRKLQRHRN